MLQNSEVTIVKVKVHCLETYSECANREMKANKLLQNLFQSEWRQLLIITTF